MINNPIKTIFFGTHEFAVTILEGLVNSPFISIELVITQPDRPVGRKQELQKSPVKLLAEKYGITVQQPEKLSNFEILNSKFEIGVVAQYGLLIPKNIFNNPKYGTLNVHTSLLPKYRGASPIQSALMNGENETGITIMKMDEGLDSGPILAQKSLKIDLEDTYPTLDKKLAKIGSQALLEAIPDYVSGEITPKNQNEAKATFCKKLNKEDGMTDWNKTAKEIYNLYRGLTPWPGIWTIWNNKRLKFLKIKPVNTQLEAGKVSIKNGNIYIGCREDSIEVEELQLEGKKAMTNQEFLNGYKNINNTLL